ncbi:hypothetical protein [Microbacterium sp. Yaish 1]|uniref:hypothetical protein n=1 Tax=Microbacterium sp. Yaish 1 TaxID=2025014 RepID=UPI000B93BBCC|nr:hypothetical protein [Microbacterium sp. Yaish 1]OYC95574.1 hypothetical protein CI089_12845 [Microbacterium sp. Yaish 1]
MTDEKNIHSDDGRPEDAAPGVAEPAHETTAAGDVDGAQADAASDAFAPAPDAAVVIDESAVEPVVIDEPAEHASAEHASAEHAPVDDAAEMPSSSEDTSAASAAGSSGEVPPQYGVGPLSIREVALAGVWAVAFICSFFPVYGRFGAGVSVWGAGIDWILTIGVPTVAVFLVLLRRFSPQGIRRVGSLGIDQFASVAFSVSATVWLGIIWSSFAGLAQSGVFLASWVVWVEVILALAGVVLTVVAPHLPVLGDDFAHRPESPAHRVARATRPVVARPASARPAPHTGPAHTASAHSAPYAAGTGAPAYTGYAAPAGYAVPAEAPASSGAPESAPADAAEPFDTGATTVIEPLAAPQAFWALAPDERDVLDEMGAPLFRIGPTAWALVIEDRGEVFVVRHEDGRVGYLHDTTDVTRG